MFYPCERKYYSKRMAEPEWGRRERCANFGLRRDRSDLVSGIVTGNWKQMCSFDAPPHIDRFLSIWVCWSNCLVLHRFSPGVPPLPLSLSLAMETRVSWSIQKQQGRSKTYISIQTDFLAIHRKRDLQNNHRNRSLSCWDNGRGNAWTMKLHCHFFFTSEDVTSDVLLKQPRRFSTAALSL